MFFQREQKGQVKKKVEQRIHDTHTQKTLILFKQVAIFDDQTNKLNKYKTKKKKQQFEEVIPTFEITNKLTGQKSIRTKLSHTYFRSTQISEKIPSSRGNLVNVECE